MNIESKYNIGDIVYEVDHQDVGYYKKCKRCNGKGFIKCLTEYGKMLKIECSKCNGYKKIYRNKCKPFIRKLTIGSIRFNSHDDEAFSYMCEETGVGSGAVYYEKYLLQTEEEAKKVAEKISNDY